MTLIKNLVHSLLFLVSPIHDGDWHSARVYFYVTLNRYFIREIAMCLFSGSGDSNLLVKLFVNRCYSLHLEVPRFRAGAQVRPRHGDGLH